ncbi:MAG: DUF3800 domain-containing protein [Patescibacteria group bacterium]
MSTTKLYCFVDETGQDTKGTFFLVVVVLKDSKTLDQLEQRLIAAEEFSGKRKQKWNKSHHAAKQQYLNALTHEKTLKESIYYSQYRETKAYVLFTALTIAKAVLAQRNNDYTVTVIIDGLNDKERDLVRTELKKLDIKYRKIRGMGDEQSAFLRLADAMAGFLRDSIEGESYTVGLMPRFIQKGIIVEI